MRGYGFDLVVEDAEQSDVECPMRRLACAVLLQAVKDIGLRNEAVRLAAQNWAGTKAFNAWCELADLEPSAVIKLRAILVAGGGIGVIYMEDDARPV